MNIFRLPILFGWIPIFFFIQPTSSVAEVSSVWVIDLEEELVEDKIIQVEPLIGLRKISAELWETGISAKGINKEILIKAAKAVPEITQEIANSGKNSSTATDQDWLNASKKVTAPWLLNSNQSQMRSGWMVSVGHNSTIDPWLVTSLPSTELYETSQTAQYPSHSSYSINPNAFRTLKFAYSTVESSNTWNSKGAWENLNYVNNQLTHYPKMKNAVEIAVGKIRFGEPQIIPILETGASPPKSLLKKYDIYILELPMTFGELNYAALSELAYGVVSSVNVNSLELVPINITRENVIQESYQTPPIEVGVDKFKIGIGKIYGREVTLKSAKPTILASGLGTHDFYWSMTDDAIHKGSRKFIAVLGVPPGTKEFLVEFWGAVKYSGFGWGEGSWASTKRIPFNIKLPF